MAGSIERQRVIGIGRQAARGSGTTADYWLRKLSFTPGRQTEHLHDESAIGNNAQTSGTNFSRRWSTPSFQAYIDLNAWGLIEYANSDSYAVATAAGETVVYDHTFKSGISSITQKFLSVNTEDATLGDEDYDDAIIDSIEMPINMNSRLMATVNLVGKYPASGTSTSSIVTPQYFYGRQVTVELAATVAAFSSSTFGATNVNFNRNNNVDSSEVSAFQLGNVDIADHVMTSKTAELTVGKVLTGATYIDYDKLATLRAVRLTIADTATTIGNASNPTMIITLPYCSIKAEESGDNNSRRLENLVITPHYGTDDDEEAAYMSKVVIRNTVADYAAV